MSLDEFKSIFWYEYLHRMMGRCIGAFFLLPATYFMAKGYVTPAIRKRLFIIGTLIGCQGLLGWYMVKSGLRPELVQEQQPARVSAYRLASHLGSAFVIYTLTLFTGLTVLASSRKPSVAVRSQTIPFASLLNRRSKHLKLALPIPSSKRSR